MGISRDGLGLSVRYGKRCASQSNSFPGCVDEPGHDLSTQRLSLRMNLIVRKNQRQSSAAPPSRVALTFLERGFGRCLSSITFESSTRISAFCDFTFFRAL